MNYNSVLKISPTGKKIAMPSLMGNNLRVFDFNTSTGIVSNHVVLSDVVSYGCEFSPDGTKLYAGVDNVYQWDLCAGDIMAIQNSSVTLFLNSTISMVSYQLAPNGKIYIGKLQNNSLAVVDDPNLSGTACNFTATGQSAGTGTVTMGLPNFLVNYFETSSAFSFTQNCNAFTFSAPALLNSTCEALRTFTASSWLFSDPASGAANASTLSIASHSFSNPGIYKVKLLLHTACGADTVSQNITVPTGPSLAIISPGTLCAGSSATLNASGADTYLWSTGSTATSLIVSPLATTVYTLSGSTTNGCSNSTTTSISIITNGSPTVDFFYKSPLCINDPNPSPELSSGFTQGGAFYSPGLALHAGTGLIDLAASGQGTFVITYSIAAQNCLANGSGTAGIVILEAPSLTLSPNVKIAPGETAVLEVKGGSSYSWTPSADLSCTDCSNPQVSPKINSVYCVTSSRQGCVDERCISVEVSCDTGGDLSLPNAFTPDGDGNNDLFCLQGWDLCTMHFSILIFDRWGEKVFESNTPSFCWDGIYKNKPLPADVFVYTVNAAFSDGDKISKKGNITLIR
jgi:gliding motility-associated-like protein